jgi:hypothetical protein
MSVLLRKTVGIVGLIVLIFGLNGTGYLQVKTNAAETAMDQLYPIELAGKYGFMNGKGDLVIKPIYDSFGYSAKPGGSVYVEDRAAKKQIYFSSTGERLFECPLRNCGILFDGLALYSAKVLADDGTAVTRYGYIDSHGKVVIQPIYHKAFNFSEGLARVNQGKATGYINTKGELVIPYRFSQTSDFSEGMAAVSLSVGGKYGFIDTSGKLVVPPRFDYVYPFSDGVAAVSVKGKYGYIDKTGKIILPPQFTMAQPFSEGLAFIERNGVTFYINKKGEKVIQNVKAGGTFSGGLAPASRGQTYGFINTSGTFVIKSQYEWANSFSGDLAEVYISNPDSRNYVRGYINRSGTIIWPVQK